MAALASLSLLALLMGPRPCWGHGKLTRPTPRDGISAGRAGLDENNPVSFEPGCDGPMNKCDAFVCREASPNSNVPVTQVTAGGSLLLGWTFTAFHVGDCAVYITYDVELPRSQQKFVKLANLPDCKSYASRSIQIPAALPAGRAILRWDWAALHIWPTVEFYVQCVDIQISSSSTASPADLDSYPIKNVYPNDGNDGVGYRNGFNGNMAQDMTGPSCVDSAINQCSLTAPGTLRNTDSMRGSPMPVPVPGPTPAPTPVQLPTTTQTPVPSPITPPAPTPTPFACVPIGDCGTYSWCDQPLYEELCASQRNGCSAPFCMSSDSPAISPSPVPLPTTSLPVPTPAPTTSTPAPSPSPSSACRASLTGLYTDASVWEPFCSTAFTAGSCPSPMCTQGTSLLGTARKHKFLGTALLQSRADTERATSTSAYEL